MLYIALVSVIYNIVMSIFSHIFNINPPPPPPQKKKEKKERKKKGTITAHLRTVN